jgi:hypothetical protein
LVKALLPRVLADEGVEFDEQEEGRREAADKRELLRWVQNGCPEPDGRELKRLARAAHTILMYL